MTAFEGSTIHFSLCRSVKHTCGDTLSYATLTTLQGWCKSLTSSAWTDDFVTGARDPKTDTPHLQIHYGPGDVCLQNNATGEPEHFQLTVEVRCNPAITDTPTISVDTSTGVCTPHVSPYKSTRLRSCSKARTVALLISLHECGIFSRGSNCSLPSTRCQKDWCCSYTGLSCSS